MTTLNLIPPEKKQEQQLRSISRVIMTFFALAIIITIFLGGLGYAINYYSKSELAKAKENLSEQEFKISKLKSIEDDVNLVNAKLKKIDTLRKDNASAILMMQNFNASVPTEAQISSLQIDRKGKKVSISGFAETRRDIVKLQSKLEESEYYKNIVFNTSTYSESTANYSFNMTGEIEK